MRISEVVFFKEWFLLKFMKYEIYLIIVIILIWNFVKFLNLLFLSINFLDVLF